MINEHMYYGLNIADRESLWRSLLIKM